MPQMTRERLEQSVGLSNAGISFKVAEHLNVHNTLIWHLRNNFRHLSAINSLPDDALEMDTSVNVKL